MNVERGTGFGAERDQVTSCMAGAGSRGLRRFIVATWRVAARSFFIVLSPIEVLFGCRPSLVEKSAPMFWLAAIRYMQGTHHRPERHARRAIGG
ncbi:hypothetical protein [Burkholderia sp. lig30]|uniref:hypothetical protein n=1 Tax=Burkholderia sp. lig30 TaxID=1192124 RepID=UPI00128FB869|nr:hypothetical protein [Burkholderia sp. lig30]